MGKSLKWAGLFLGMIVSCSSIFASVSICVDDFFLLGPGELSIANAINDITDIVNAGGAGAVSGQELATQWNNLTSTQQDEIASELNNDKVINGSRGTFSASKTYNSGMSGRMKQVRVAQISINQPDGPAGPTAGNSWTEGWATWGQFLSTWADQDRRDHFTGYKYDTQGVIVGVDKQIGNFLVGINTGYTGTDLDADVVNNNTDIDAWQVGAYASYAGKNYYIDSGFSFAFSDIDSRRKLVPVNATAKGDTDSDTFSIFLNSGYNIALTDKWILTPNVGFQYTYTEVEGYTETGAGNWNQVLQGYDTDSFSSTIGARALYLFNKRLSGELRAAWEYEYVNEDTIVRARLDIPGSQFRNFKGLRPHDSALAVGVGLNGAITEQISTYINYDYTVKDDFDSHSLNAGLRVTF